MKKIDFIGNEPRQKRSLQSINDNFQEIYFKRMQILDSDPVDNLSEGMLYYNKKIKKLRLLINTNPVQWQTIT